MSHTRLFEELVADGRVRHQPYRRYMNPTVLEVNLDLLANRLKTILKNVYRFHDRLRNHYPGTSVEVTEAIDSDIDAMTDFALMICYNRLRSVCERYSANIRTTRCNPRAPVNNRLEFPAWISSLLGSIGSLRIPDAASDMLIIYVPPVNTMNNYGRGQPPTPIEGNYSRITTCLRTLGIALTPIDMNCYTGSFWTTCILTIEDRLYSLLAPFHESHYTNDDVIRSFIFTSNPAENPFTDIGFVYSFVDNAATIAALANVAAPAGIPAGSTANDPTRPVGASFHTNYYGFSRTVAAAGDTPAVLPGIYIIGRGTQRLFTSYLATRITVYEVLAILREVLTSTGAPPPAET